MAVQVVKVRRPAQSMSQANPLLAILSGLWVSTRHFFRNLSRFARGRQDFAIHFPEQRLVQPPALRGMPVLVQMENGKERCVACGLCEWACPTTCITIYPAETADEVERYPEIFDIDMARCMFCGLCEEACPEEAIVKLGPGRRYSVEYDKCTGCAACFEQCPCHAIEMVPEPAAHA